MSVPIAIRSNSASKGSLYDLLQLPPSPPTFVTERHACAFPSWPNRPSLSCPPTSNPTPSSEGSEFFTELDLLGQRQQQQARQTRLRRPSNYLELEFEEDSDDEDSSSDQSSNESTPCGSQTDNQGAVRANPSAPNTRSALSNQLRKYKNAHDLRRKVCLASSAIADD
jgi:hypothetical protein